MVSNLPPTFTLFTASRITFPSINGMIYLWYHERMKKTCVKEKPLSTKRPDCVCLAIWLSGRHAKCCENAQVGAGDE